ncbi:MAG: 50S ribosomal protein L11 methyltransferase, partial [Paracoccus sp. (in: a-proteobacteria)]
GRVICIEAVGFHHQMLDDAAPFDLVFANILKQPLVELAPDMEKHVSAGGRIILSGILNEQADEVIAVYQGRRFALEHRAELGEWTTLTMRQA